jgi:hypothetical protein
MLDECHNLQQVTLKSPDRSRADRPRASAAVATHVKPKRGTTIGGEQLKRPTVNGRGLAEVMQANDRRLGAFVALPTRNLYGCTGVVDRTGLREDGNV